MRRDLIKRIEAIVLGAEEHAGTLPAKEAVKLRPADWHAVCRVAREAAAALEAEASEGERRGLERGSVDRTAAIESFRRWYFNHTGKRIYHNNAGVAVNVVLDAVLIPAPAREGE